MTKLLSGDCNTKYFHPVANDKHRKTRIVCLEQDDGIIEVIIKILKCSSPATIKASLDHGY